MGLNPSLGRDLRVNLSMFYAPGSSSVFPHIVLYEPGLPFTAIKIDEHTKKMEGGGDYRQVNPLGYIVLIFYRNDLES